MYGYAAAVIANNRHRGRAENVKRIACQSEEKCESIQLTYTKVENSVYREASSSDDKSRQLIVVYC